MVIGEAGRILYVSVAAELSGGVDVRDEDKTREQLIDELAQLRKQNAEYKQSQTQKLDKRIKELNCIYAIFQIVERQGIPLEEILQWIVDLTPRAWQYPEITCARIILDGQDFRTENFRETTRKQTSDIIVYGTRIGTLEICYLKEMQERDEEPLVKEERNLLNAIATQLGRIIERKQAKEALQESEDRYRVLVENANEAILVAQDEIFKFVNPKAIDLMGYSRDELGSRPFAEFIHPDDRNKVTERYQRRLEGAELPQTYPFRIVDEAGDTKWVELNAAVIAWEGRPATLNFLTDITERRKAEERIRELAKFPSQNPNPVLRIEKDGTILYGNEASQCLLSVWGCTVGQPISGHLSELISDVLSSGSSRNTEVKCEDYVFALTFAPVADAGYINVYGLDITERKRMEEELVKAQKLESVSILAGGLAHDFNNILTAILGNISLAKMYDDLEKKNSRLTDAERACMQAKDLTQQLLTFSKGGAPIKKVTSMVKLLKDSAIFALKGSNVNCEFSVPDDLWPAEVDQGQMNQVLSNIIINADQAMPDGGTITICGENSIIESEHGLPLQPGPYVEISIADQGTGVPEEHLQRISDPYFTTKQTGSGLGLAVAYSIARKHNGHIAVESLVAAGTTFHIYLPASPEAVLVVEEQEEEKPITGAGRTLVMDDEKYVRDLAAEMLISIGYKVTTARDGAEAIEMYQEARDLGRPYDAVIMDLTVPGGMGGKETIQRLIEIDPKVKAIVSSGYSNDPIMAAFREYGFRGVIAKPYKTRELSQVMHEVMVSV